MEYIFTVRKKFGMETVLFPEFTYNNFSQDKENKYYTEYVDVKSEGPQNILREIFKDVNGVSLREDKPSVSRSFTISEGGRMLLPCAAQAIFSSSDKEHKPHCLLDTRERCKICDFCLVYL